MAVSRKRERETKQDHERAGENKRGKEAEPRLLTTVWGWKGNGGINET